MAEAPTIRWWQSLTTLEADRLAESDPVVVLPLAAVEQHGPHLPLSTDLDIGLGLIEEAFRGLAASGVRRLVLCNSHGGNRQALDDAGLRLRDAHAMLVVKASWFRFPRPEDVGIGEAEWKHGLHAGAVETAMMLHLRPELVRERAAADARSLGQDLEGELGQLGPEGAASFAWLAGDLHPSGAVGDARAANAALGAKLVAHYGSVLAEVIRDARAFPLDRLA